MHRIAWFVIAFATVQAVFLNPTTAATCPGGIVGNVTKSTKAVRLSEKIFFRTNGLQLDFDGSPVAYGVRDQGQENICDGLAPSTGRCRGKYSGTCYPVCQSTFAQWSRTSGDPGTLGETMCSNGLGGSNCSRPDVKLQSAPNEAYFVSETSLKVSPPTGDADHAWLQGQGAQVDPAKIKYLVVPHNLMVGQWNATLGDVGIAFNDVTRQTIPFIVGDGGGLGEASVSLLAALRPDQPPQLQPGRSALGKTVQRYLGGINGNFRFVIFKGTASNLSDTDSTHVTARSAAELAHWIETTANEGFRGSSVKEIMDCSERAPAIKK